MVMLDKLSMHNTELEFAVLKCLMQFPEYKDYIYRLTLEDFYSLSTQDLFKVIFGALDENKTIDLLTIPESYRKKYGVASIISGEIVMSHNFETYYKELKDIANKRRLEKVAYDIGIMIKEDRTSIYIKNEIENKMQNLYQACDTRVTQNAAVDEEFIEKMIKKSVRYIESGFVDIDNVIGGFMPSTFTIVAGAPTIGKTTLVLNMVNHICRFLKKKVLFVSLEMNYLQLQAKLVSQLTRVNSRYIINPRMSLNKEELVRIDKARGIIEGYELYRMGDKKTTVFDIEEELKERGDIDIVFIDYLQLLSVKSHIVSRYDRVTQISTDLKRMSRKFNIPIVCIASINRAKEGRANKVPLLSDLRDSGNIEYDIDTALLLHRETETRDYTSEVNSSQGEALPEAQVIVAKNRFGEADLCIKLLYEPRYSKFKNIYKEEKHEQTQL